VARNYLVQLDDLYLTSDGTSGGIRCKSEVPALDQLLLDHVGSTIIPITGRPFEFIREIEAGFEIEIKPYVITQAVEGSLKMLQAILFRPFLPATQERLTSM
jgi:hypothetical protein